MRAQHGASLLTFPERVPIDEQRLGACLLHVHHRADLGDRDLRFGVVALVEHESYAAFRLESRCGDDLVHDPEELERIRSTHHEIVVGIETTVEVKAAQLPGAEQQSH
jgi:hypothetical protein